MLQFIPTELIDHFKMKNCELCTNSESRWLRQKMVGMLESKGVSSDRFIESSPQERINLLVNSFGVSEMPQLRIVKCEENKVPGLVVVKPEMYPFYSDVENYLARLGIDILRSEQFTYTPQQHWNVYGTNFVKYFDQFPHGALLTLTSASLPSRLVTFNHLSPEKYLEKYKELNGVYPSKNLFPEIDWTDPQSIFDKLFVKGNTSIRSMICTPNLAARGFDTLKESECPGKCWDFTGTFKTQGVRANLNVFNGVHSPNNRSDVAQTLAIIEGEV